MTRNDIILSLMRAGMLVGRWELDDDAYEPISAAFVQQAWTAWVQSLPDELKRQLDIGGGKSMTAPRWIPEVYDCDDIALDFGVFLDRCMAVAAVQSGKPRGNSGSGRFDFLLNADPKTGHCRNWFVDYDGNAQVFDAGDCSFPTLTAPERPTVSYGESI